MSRALHVDSASNPLKNITIRFSMLKTYYLLPIRFHMYNYYRTELFVGSRFLPGFTKCKEKINDLPFRVIPIPYRLGIGKSVYSKKLATF